MRPTSIIIICVCTLIGCTTDSDPDLPDVVDFNRHIRPILSNNCFVCHGPDEATREADLRLDTREFATAELENGRAIVPGSVRRSLLMQRITAHEADDRMPPPEAKKTLTPREIALLERWIEQGAEYKKHWSLIPPEVTAVPETDSERAVNDIDRFILALLEPEGITPAPEASKETLIRRLSYVLTGLPPTPEAVDAFLADDRPEAYETLVDQLLASPHFGERWARHWMDLVRYADSKGHEFDYTIDGAWRYRDYLIRAFNRDVPYDQFVIEHLAGDLLTTPRRHPEEGFNESIIGTAYLTLGEGKHSPVDLREDEADRIDNIIDVTTKTFQGLTVACARCHDHKFDPIPTTDYYSLYGIFESTRFTPVALHSRDMEARLDTVQVLKSEIRQTLASGWEQALADRPPVTLSALQDVQEEVIARQDSVEMPKARLLGDFRQGSYDGWYPHGTAFGDAPVMGDPILDRSRMQIVGFETGKATSKQWRTGLHGALRSPTFTIEHDTLLVRAAGRNSEVRVVIDNFQLIRYPIHGGLRQVVDSPDMTDLYIDVEMWKGSKAYIELLVGSYAQNRYISEQHTLVLDDQSYIEAEYAVAFSDRPPDVRMDFNVDQATASDVRQAVRDWASNQAGADQVALLDHALKQGDLDASLQSVESQLETLDQVASRPFHFGLFNGVTEGDRIESPVFVRGNHTTLSDERVPHRFFTALSGEHFTRTPSGRLELAEAIVDPNNPLTARVMVNRIWHHVFGRGLVETVDNFGVQGKPPTHPVLLDQLALRFVDSGWSIKSMIREMVLSSTFRQSTSTTEHASAVDPQNLLWHHYPVRRLESEAVRDAILAVSGRLDRTMYGEPVPIHLTEFMTGRGRPPETGPLDGAGRRSIYIAVRRNFLSPFMLAFDQPIPFSTFGKRNVSNVPAQSLTLLNDSLVARQSMLWAERIAAMDSLSIEARIDYIYKTAFARSATPEEIADARMFLEQQAQEMGLAPNPSAGDPRPWYAFCHAMINLKEFIYLI